MFLTIKLFTHAKLFEIELITCIKIDLALNNLQRLICYKTQTTNYTFPKGISTLQNANSLVQVVNSGLHIHFIWW